MTIQWLTGWWNLIFIVPFALALLYLGLYTLSGWTFGEVDADAGIDHDIDAHLNAGGHLEFDHDIDADADADGDSDGNAAGQSAVLTALNWIGVGQMPLSLIVMIQMLCWGVIGFAGMQVQRGVAIGQEVIVSAIIAALGASLITHVVSSILGPRLFRATNTVRRWHQLLGSRGEAMYPIDARFGMVCGRDDRGELFQAACRTAEGFGPLAKGDAVQLVAYAAKERMFYVVPADSATTPRLGTH